MHNYKRCMVAILLCLFALLMSVRAQNVVQYVQPMSGTAAATTPAVLKHGEASALYANTIPAVTVPFAMTQWAPQTQVTENKGIPRTFIQTLYSAVFVAHTGSAARVRTITAA